MGKDNHLDDLPQRGLTHDIEKKAVVAFEKAIVQEKLFTVQTTDRKDYGTDIQIEAHAESAMTNTRIHVQLKGTTTGLNADGSASVSVDRTNLNYLTMQSHSIYVCYHIPSDRLLVKPAEDVYSQYGRKGNKWQTQKTITIKCKKVNALLKSPICPYFFLNPNALGQLKKRDI